MRHVKVILLAAVAAAVLIVLSPQDTRAFPGAGGTTVFSVVGIDPAHDISLGPYGPSPPFVECTSADILAGPFFGPFGPCTARAAPAPPGPVPDGVTLAPLDLGLNFFGPFSDDLEDFSFNEALGTPAVDFDFSVDPAPFNGGVTVGAPFPAACVPFLPNVTTEAGALEAQGDIFTTGFGVPFGCNTQATDEAALGLIAPNPGFPPLPPLDDMDALGEYSFPPPAACTLVGGSFASVCATYTLTAGSAALPLVFPPDGVTFAPATGGTILAQPGSPAAPPGLPGGCLPGGLPCAAVGFPLLGLFLADDVDALCWFDVIPNGAPDIPVGTFGPGTPGDLYVFSLVPGSPALGAFGLSAADLLTTTVPAGGPPVVVRTAASLGLLSTDDVDALICHDMDADSDLVPAFLDNCPAAPDSTLLDTDSDGVGDVCDPCPTVPNGVPAWPVPPLDADCDGFTSADEGPITTDPLDPCGFVAGPPTQSGTWPADLVESNSVNISDVLVLKPVFGTAVPVPTSPRFDIVPSGLINIADVLRLKPFFGLTCTP